MADMTLGLSWFRLVPLVALLWGLPVEATADISRRVSFSQTSLTKGVEKLEVAEPQPLLMPVKQRVGQTAAVKQHDTEQAVLFSVEGTLAEGDERLRDESLHDVHVFEGQAEQIVRITLTSDEFDTFLILQDASGEELARNDDGSDGTDAEIVFRLPKTEQYRIVANAYDASGKGAYQLIIEEANEATLYQVEQKNEADRLFQQGTDTFRSSQYRTAQELWQSAVEIYVEIGDLQGEANSLGNLGLAYRSLGEYKRAIDFHQQSLAISKEIGDRQGEANSLGNLGLTYRRLSEYERAIDFYQQSLAIAKEIGDRQGEANSLGNLGSAYFSLGEYERAVGFHQQSLAIDREIGDRQGEANSLGSLGLTYHRLGKYERAIDFHQQFFAIAKEIGDRQGEANSLGSLGLAYYSLGEYERAIDFYQQSLAIKREIGDRHGEANSLGNLGLAYHSLGEYERTIDFHQHSLAIAKEIGNRRGEAVSLSNLGSAYFRLGEYERAVGFHQQSLAIDREIGNRQGEAYSLGNLGITYESLGEYEQAINFLQQTLALAKEIGNRQGEALALNYLGVVWENQSHPETAAIFYKESINVYEAIRNDLTGLEQTSQTAYIDSVERPYRSLIDILLTQGRILEAQQVLELLKVEELREFTRATYRNGELRYDPIEEPVRAAHNTLINFGSEIYACGQTCDPVLRQQRAELLSNFNNTVATFEDTIRENRADDDDFYDPQNFTSDARRIVDAEPGTVLIYPVVLEDTLWLLWTATGGVVGSVEVPAANQADLSTTVLRFRELLTQTDEASLAELKQVGQQLHSWLIEPISTELEANNIQRLVFAQDRATRYIPMAALHDGEQFLIENYTVSTVLSADLTDTSDRLGEVDAANTLGLGLDQAVEGFSALPNVLEELQAVIKEDATDTTGIYPGSVFMNGDFTFNTLSEQVYKHRILHIATHAEFVPNVQDASYLLDGNGEQITIDQIGSLALEFDNLHLVVLSACQTALGGPSLDGTEIAGVSSYFLGTNKAEAVLATLWRVDDAGTSLLMQRFYELMATGDLTKAEALQQAQLSLLNQEDTLDQRFENLGLERGLANANAPASSPAALDHPYYWAPFILIGNSL